MNLTKLSVLFAFIIWLLFWTGCDKGAEEEQTNETVVVKTAAVVRQKLSRKIQTSGVLSAEAEVKLSFKIAGIVERILVEEGASVHKGQMLARLDLSEIEAKVVQARSAAEKMKRDLERIERLYADSVATLEQLQDAATGFEVAASNLHVAEFNLQHASIYAPNDGKILKRFVERNELVSSGMPIFLFGSTGRGWIIRVGVTDREVVQLQLEDSAAVFFDAYPGVRFRAFVSEIAEFADPMSGTYEVELRIDPGSYKLVSGFVARVGIVLTQQLEYYVIPIEALVEAEGNSGFVYVLEESGTRVRKVAVRINMILQDAIAVTGRLEGTTKIITVGAPYLTDSSLVEVVNEK